MKRIRLIARKRRLEPKTGKPYSDAKLMTVNAYYEDVFEQCKTTPKTAKKIFLKFLKKMLDRPKHL